MPGSIDLLLGLLERGDPTFVTQEDLDGPHRRAFRAWQAAGFLSAEPDRHPTPSCPHCGEGVPMRVASALICGSCHSIVDPRHLLAWRFDREAFLGWVSGRLGLSGGVRPVGPVLWQLGTLAPTGDPCECFFAGPGTLTREESARLAAYRNAAVLYATRLPRGLPPETATASLLSLLRTEPGLGVGDLDGHLGRHWVRFDPGCGALWAGHRLLGEVPVGGNECHLLACLAERVDCYVPYSDLARGVLRRSGGRDTRDEATFCHELKRRIKRRFIPDIDLVLTTNNKGAGYRLRARLADAPRQGPGAQT